MTFKQADFQEKINIQSLSTFYGRQIGTVNYITKFPGKITLHCILDLFNVKESYPYRLELYLVRPNQYSDKILSSTIRIEESILIETNDGYGKTSINFDFVLSLVQSGDYRLDFILSDKKNNELDKKYIYLYFGTEEN